MNKIRLVISLAITIFALVYLVAVAIPNIQRANEEVRQAEIAVEQSQAEVDQAMADIEQQIDALNANFMIQPAFASTTTEEADTDNPFSRIERGTPFIPAENTTYTCPDGTEIPAVQECDTPTGPAECPPNKVVMMNAAGECIVIGDPIQCPDGTLVPTESECSSPPSIIAPVLSPPVESESQLVDTPCGPIDPNKSMCNYLPQDPNEPTAAEEAERAEQEQGQNEGEENEQGSEEQQQEDESSNGSNDNDGGEGNGAGGDDDGGETD